MRIAIEMAMNPDVCVNLSELRRGTDLSDDQTNELKIHMVYGTDVELPPGDISGEETIRSIYACATMKSVKSGNHLTMWEMLALCNVLGCPVKSVFPTKRTGPVRDCRNRMIAPRVCSTPDVATNLWTRCSPCTAGIWTPNHFVPLLTMGGDVSCEVIDTTSTSEVEIVDVLEELLQTCQQIIEPTSDLENTGDVSNHILFTKVEHPFL